MCFGGSGEGKSEETVRAQIAEGGQIDRAFVELCTIALVVLMCVDVRMKKGVVCCTLTVLLMCLLIVGCSR